MGAAAMKSALTASPGGQGETAFRYRKRASSLDFDICLTIGGPRKWDSAGLSVVYRSHPVLSGQVA